MRSSWIIQLGLKSNDKCPNKRHVKGNIEEEAVWQQKQKSDVARSQELPGATRSWKSQENVSSRGFRGLLIPWLQVLASRTVREYICVILIHHVYGNLLQQPLENNIGMYPAIFVFYFCPTYFFLQLLLWIFCFHSAIFFCLTYFT